MPPTGTVRAAIAVVAIALGAGVSAFPAAAQQATLDRGWSQTDLDPGERVVDSDVASVGIGETIAVYGVSRSPDRPEIRTRSRGFGAPFDATQVLDRDSFYPTVAGSVLGGAVATWYHEPTRELRIAERAPGASAFAEPLRTASTPSNYSYGRPLLAVGPTGDAAVAYLVVTSSGEHQLVARVRPAGGSFGPPEAVSPPLPMDDVYGRDLDVGADGTVVAGFVHSGRAAVAIRPPGGPFGAPERLGGPAYEHSWRSPQVGVSAAGDVAVLWLEDDGRYSGPVRVAFRPRGAAAFGAPQRFGDDDADDLGRLHLGVSAVGEVVAAVESTSSQSANGGHLEGIHVAFGDARRGVLGAPSAISGIWGSYPSFAMNERGDALVVYDDYPTTDLRIVARRRGPLGSFGPEVDLTAPIRVPPGGRSGIVVREADLDAFGMGRVLWEDFETDRTFAAEDGPRIESEPPAVPAPGDVIAPVLPARPDPPADPPAGAPGVPAPETGSSPDGPWLPPYGSSGQYPPPIAPPPAMPLTPPQAPGDAPAGTRAVPVGDRSAPAVRVGRPGRVVPARAGRAARVRLTLRCSERCRARVAARLGERALRPVEVAAAAGRTVGFDLALPRRAPSRTLRLDVGAADAAGNVRTVRRAFALPRR